MVSITNARGTMRAEDGADIQRRAMNRSSANVIFGGKAPTVASEVAF